MAVQPFTQIMWGKPKIEVETSTRDGDNSRYLDIYLFNRPIDNSVLRRLGVRREIADDVFAQCRIENIHTHEVCVEQMFPAISVISNESPAVSLPGSSTPASILIVCAHKNLKATIPHSGRGMIKPGVYELTVRVHYGENITEKKFEFSVGSNYYELNWNN